MQEVLGGPLHESVASCNMAPNMVFGALAALQNCGVMCAVYRLIRMMMGLRWRRRAHL